MAIRIPHGTNPTEVRRAFQKLKDTFFDESSDVNHDATTNFVANEHIDHTAVSVSAGTGLTGGGTIAANRTISLSHLGIESLTDPGADRIAFWDESANALKWLAVGANLTITDTTIAATGGVTDHGALTGLSDDDHTQYFLADGTRDITGPFKFQPATHDFLFTHNSVSAGGNRCRLAIQGQTAGDQTFLDLYTKDGDRTDDVGIVVWGMGIPTNNTNAELLEFRYDSGGPRFSINTLSGGTGVLRPIWLYTSGNDGQFRIETNGGVTMKPAGHEFLFIDNSVSAGGNRGRLAIECQTPNDQMFLDLFTQQGDDGDDIGIVIWALGHPAQTTPGSLMEFRYDAGNSEFALDTLAGGGATLRAINIYTQGHRNQLIIRTDGAVSMSGALAVTGNITGPNVSSGADPGHTHTGASLSSIDISADTNLAATAPVVLTDDTLTLDYEATDFSVVGTTLTITNGGIDHDATTNFDANKHIDHTSVTLTAGSGLSGGGTIAANRTFDLDINGLAAATPAVAADAFPFHDDTAGGNKKITFANLETSMFIEHLGTALTAGSVAFSDGSNLAQDNAKFFWDNGNDRLGVGMTAPALTLQVHFAGTGRVVGFYATDADSVGEESLIHIGGNQATAHYGVMIGGTPEVSSPSVQDWAFIVKTNPGTGVAHTERIRVSSNGHMGINETDPKDYLHVSKAASTGAPGIRITDTTAQAINVGGGIGFWGKYTDAGATAMAALIRANKINSTTGNNGFALKFYIRYPGSTGVQEVATLAGDGQNGQLAIANAPQAANVVANAVGMLCTGQYYGTGRVTGTVSGFNATGRIRTGAAAGTTTQLRAGNYAIQNDDADTIVTNAKGLSIATPGNAGTFTNTYGLQIQSQTVGTQTNTPYGVYQEGSGDFNYFAGKVGIAGSSPTAFLDVNSDIIRLRTAKTPASSGAAGNQGDICWDASYIYVCTATNTWERAAIAVW